MRRFAAAAFIALTGFAESQPITEALVFPISPGTRAPFAVDPMQRRIVTGSWTAPTSAVDGWIQSKANAEGVFESSELRSAYVYASITAPAERVVLLEAERHSLVYVNGVPRAGDPYGYGFMALPIKLNAGSNDLLFVCGRGSLRARVVEPAKPITLRTQDPTLPDIVYGERGHLLAGLVVVNVTEKPLRNWRAKAKTELGGGAHIESVLPTIPPMSVRKVAVRLAIPSGSLPDRLTYQISLMDAGGREADAQSFELWVRKPDEVHKRTFMSNIDNSVQYYAVNPAKRPFSQNALILSLHGASVEALGQAEAYSQKDWATLVAPTNRRPFGFDWEDWGRLDLFEVLAEARKHYPFAEDRVSLTGHSMGGHGAWINAALFPGQWASAGPSAGWTSFWTYAGAWNPASATPVEGILRRAMNASDTTLFARNLVQPPLYVLHGDADDNVPVEQARTMRDMLKGWNKTPAYHEEAGAGHWWDKDGPGAACVDWQPMLKLFQDARRPSHPIALDFTTVNPAISARGGWITVVQQELSMLPSRVVAEAPDNNVIRVRTENVRRLLVHDASPQVWGFSLHVDGQPIALEATLKEPVQLIKAAGKWVVTRAPRANEKGPHRGGPFKEAFKDRFVFVYGTAGTPEENAWAEAKARYDAETFYYRGNGSVEVLADHELKGMRDRNVILYGNMDTNKAWSGLLADAPVKVRRGSVHIGDRTVSGDFACLFAYPRKGSDVGLVAAVSGSGMTGLRLTERLPYFVSGVAYPDWVVFGPEVLSDGPAGAVGAGFFDNEWRVDPAQSAWK